MSRSRVSHLYGDVTTAGLIRAAKFGPTLGAYGLWAGRDLYHATPAVTWDLGFSGLIQRTAPFSRLLRHTEGCAGPILTRILTGPKRNFINNDGYADYSMLLTFKYTQNLNTCASMVFFFLFPQKNLRAFYHVCFRVTTFDCSWLLPV
jgi:hypothetical protein